MLNRSSVPRPGLFTVGDAQAWDAQFHMLFYVLSMSPARIAQIDHGFDPDDPDAWPTFCWAQEIEGIHPRVDVARIIDRLR